MGVCVEPPEALAAEPILAGLASAVLTRGAGTAPGRVKVIIEAPAATAMYCLPSNI